MWTLISFRRWILQLGDNVERSLRTMQMCGVEWSTNEFPVLDHQAHQGCRLIRTSSPRERTCTVHLDSCLGP
ncbi:unnamed protein product [Calypogeia fissa]